MILRARIRPRDDNGERQDLRAEADDYFTARDMLDAQTPDGWIRMYLITGDDE